MSDVSAPTPAPGRSRARPLLLALIVLALLALVGALYLQDQLAPPKISGAAQTFEVEPGWGASRVARELADAGLVKQPQVFSLWLRYKDLDRSIGEGLYNLSPAMSASEVARVLEAGGRPRVVSIVIPEGFRASDVAARLAGAGLGDETALMNLIEEPGALRLAFVPEGAGLEGFLFPASYEFPLRSAPEEALGVILERFSAELTPEVSAALQANNLSVYDWVTLASVVQAEAGTMGEMPIIAGVFRNRLDAGMRLQSDPTVAYGLGKPMTALDAPAGDFEVDQPWNTYLYAGLPPTPISNPGQAALLAVLNPQRDNPAGAPYLYFLHDRNLVFRPNLTLEDHERDVQEFLR